ncbi:S1 family peptidase [Pseudobacteriovorax antillogorgiicola]|uniref:Trypsin-like peptidase domain-containing protein n=1 Tax=Pseudobacteriovorax antillogorgiicola TaxID=1513793 RepID=A0A1Y6CNE2_9BACT|nr:serine protease [Pseudobacteriovorax antillogorgiicola]TCS44818.1 trypsin-like peptidase [Pseudobacteriovorax antillogorgiicola]SMF77253.1 Trypsin-like peptidase domain-containing protein [Pseudobacteriovorax antillogorgiicola]
MKIWLILIAMINTETSLAASQWVSMIRDSVFEVVVHKHDDYPFLNRKIDTSDIPYVQRISPYRSIGTAFFIAPNRLVSAAHVVDIFSRSWELGTYYIRDQFDQIHQIANIHAYDQEKDLVVFDLKTYPRKVRPLPIRYTSQRDLGIDLCAPGNAIGEGISYRCGGQLALFTPEPLYGRWQNIRFSTPASPGNSGGPLLTKTGQVIGIIVRKSKNENLNEATPIQEVYNTKGAIIRDLKHEIIEERGLTTKHPIELKYATPVPIQVLWKRIVKDLDRKRLQAIKHHQKNFSFSLYPNSRHIYRSIRDGAEPDRLGGLLHTQNGRQWGFLDLGYRDVQTADGVSLAVGSQSIDGLTPFYVYSQSLKDRGIVEKYFNALGSGLTLFNSRYRLISLGESDRKVQMTDHHDRLWQMSFWNVKAMEWRAVLACTTIPSGKFCLFQSAPYEHLGQAYFYELRNMLNQLVFTYKGSYRDWEVFLEHRNTPSFVKDAIQFDEEGVLYSKLGEKLIYHDNADLIELVPNYKANRGKLKLTSGMIVSVPVAEEPSNITIFKRVFAPSRRAPGDIRAAYRQIKKKEFPFNGQVFKNVNKYFKMDVVHSEKKYQFTRICVSRSKVLLRGCEE